METWIPETDEPELLDWWRPLIEFSRRLRIERFPWPAHIDEFALAGRVDRRGKSPIWIYRHRVSDGFVNVDEQGRPHRFIPYRSGPARGRFAECDLRGAGWRAGLPDVVEPIDWTRAPGDVGVGRAVVGSGLGDADGLLPAGDDRDRHDRDWGDAAADTAHDHYEPRPTPARGRARGHLRLVPGTGGATASRPA